MNVRKPSFWKWTALIGIAGVACGGSTVATVDTDAGDVDGGADATIFDATNDAGDPGHDAIAPRDGGADVPTLPTFCPTSAPTVGAPCTRARTCEYGSANDPFCNTRYTCDGTTWFVDYDAGNCGYSGTNAASCPATWADAVDSGSCEFPSAPCEYPEGRCDCSVGHCGGAHFPDAGTQWTCSGAYSGCPSPRGASVIGATCTTPGLVCGYGSCCTGILEQSCGDAGVWEELIVSPCP